MLEARETIWENNLSTKSKGVGKERNSVRGKILEFLKKNPDLAYTLKEIYTFCINEDKSDNNYKKIPQIGNVILEDYVEIGANATIDRATMGSTIIRKGVKLDNLTHIAHNVEVGENTVMAAQSGIAGSTKIGKNCMFGGQVGFAPHITIADGVKAAAQSGIASSIKEENLIVMGAPAYKISDYQKSYVGFRKLPEIIKQIRDLENEIKELKKNQK